MLLNINTKTKQAEKRRAASIQKFGFDERALQSVLFKSLDRLFPEDEMILLMQSRNWQEEPDLMAVDKNGDLFIFELKAVGSHSENLLQVLRYGQIFGSSRYVDLDALYKRSTDKSQSLKAVHKAKFGVELPEEKFNQRQKFVVMTNGIDSKTREAVQYWRSTGLDVRPWVYRVYEGGADEMLLEMSPFRVDDNPYEDLAEGYYILNTNIGNSVQDHELMLKDGKASAFFDPWKYKIERLAKGDVVFLYQSGVGIVAVGEADGTLLKAPYQGNEDDPDEDYSMKLNRFQDVDPPLSASEIKKITGVNHVFMHTMFGLDADSGKAVRKFIVENGRAGG
ncbi:hypothetical protein [uncultured Deefgea sp.]|uniref:hypothetical protein n=1 Tax=uncultured Deefgea sp. TaxID=1304914 RepID=UPI00263120EE|nr:hypothetical protein [uncultured Deefgea sp.]